jgi:hypothetical protein
MNRSMIIVLRHLSIVLLLLGCNTNTAVKVEKVEVTKVDKEREVPIPPAPTGLSVSAYLVYADSSISTFDVLNDKTKALWNTIIGAGDAGQPSTSTKIKLTGQLYSLRVIIFNGRRKVIDEKLPNFSGDYDFILKDTGCEEVKVNVTKRGISLFKGDIPFHCGE